MDIIKPGSHPKTIAHTQLDLNKVVILLKDFYVFSAPYLTSVQRTVLAKLRMKTPKSREAYCKGLLLTSPINAS